MQESKLNINSNEYLPLRDSVFNTLRDSILLGKLKPGERLLENQLAEKLGVSRTPIREALRMLEIENLVELTPRKGAQVLDMTEKDIKNILEVRASLESLGVKLSCERMNSKQIEYLKEIQKEFISACESLDYEKTANIDEKFHDAIFAATKNDKLIQIINNIRIQLYRYRITYLKNEGWAKIAIEHHNKIIEYIQQHKKDEGEKIAAEHIEHQAKMILELINKKQNIFPF